MTVARRNSRLDQSQSSFSVSVRRKQRATGTPTALYVCSVAVHCCGAAAPPGADPCDGILNDLGLYTRVRGRSFSWRRGAMVRWLIRQPGLCGQFAPLTRSRAISWHDAAVARGQSEFALPQLLLQAQERQSASVMGRNAGPFGQNSTRR